MSNVDNSEDILDSRDIIERIDELDAERRPFTAGWNVAGYMPDNEPSTFETFTDALEFIRAELDDVLDGCAPNQKTIDDIEGLIREIDGRLILGPELSFVTGGYCYWIQPSHQDGLDDADWAEYQALKHLADKASSSPDWRYGETLIRDSYFEEYAQELAEDCGMIPKGLNWPCTCIDWEQAARELQMDYFSVDFDGIDYWIRA